MQIQVDDRDGTVYTGFQFGNYFRTNRSGEGRAERIVPQHELGERPFRFNWQTPIWLKNAETFALKYSHSFFWGAGMCLGMVPQDVEPVTFIENAVTTIALFTGLVLNAFVMQFYSGGFYTGK